MTDDSPGFEPARAIGLPVAAGTFDAIGTGILDLAQSGAPAYICVAATHPLSLAHGDPAFAEVFERAAMVTPDGTPISWLLRLKGWHAAQRVSGPDLAPWLIAHAEADGIPVYFYGGMADEIAALKQAISVRYPALRVVGWEAPPKLPERPDFDPEAVARMRESGARLIFVGLGCPRQEWWMSRNSAAVPATMVGIGAAFNFLSGRLERAPLWMRRAGLEWLHRLCSEPRRLWKRYLVHNSRFLWFALGDLLAHCLKHMRTGGNRR